MTRISVAATAKKTIRMMVVAAIVGSLRWLSLGHLAHRLPEWMWLRRKALPVFGDTDHALGCGMLQSVTLGLTPK